MSGGQRQRCSIARAVYADADIYILDDPLSALDAHVTADLFAACIKSHLKSKIIFLATNQLHLMPQMDRILVMEQGRIVQSGTFKELLSAADGAFQSLYKDIITEESHEEKAENKAPPLKPDSKKLPAESKELVVKNKSAIKIEAIKDDKVEAKKDAGKLVQAEGHTIGSIGFGVYSKYFSSVGMLIDYYFQLFSCFYHLNCV